MDGSNEKTKEGRIKSEISRLKRLYGKIPKEFQKDTPEYAAAKEAANERIGRMLPLIKNAAFMAIALEDLQVKILEDGATQEYQNGANQKGTKRSATVDVYDSMVKTLGGVMKQLDDMAKEGKQGGKGKPEDPFQAIRARGKT